MNIISLLASDSYIVVNKELIKEFGLEESIVIGDLASMYLYLKKENKLDENEFFFYTVESMQSNTSLSEYQQRKALDYLKSKGIVDVIRKDMPAKRYIKLNIPKLEETFLRTSSVKITEQDLKKVQNYNNIDISKDISNNNIYNNTFSKEKDTSLAKKELIDIGKKSKEKKEKVDKSKILANNVKKSLSKFSLNTQEIELLSNWIDELYDKNKGIGTAALSLAVKQLLEINSEDRIAIIEKATLNGWRDFSYCITKPKISNIHINDKVETNSELREQSLKEVKDKIKDGGVKGIDYY